MSAQASAPLSGRQRLMTVLRGGTPDRIPFVPLVNEFFWATLSPECGVDDVVSCCRCIGADIAERWVPSYLGYGLEFGSLDDSQSPGSPRRREERSEDEILVRFETPVGTLTQRQRRTDQAGSTWYKEEHLVKSGADLRAYQYLWDAVEPQAAYHLTQERIDAIGDEGLALVRTPCTPILHLIMYDLGLERLAYLMADHRKEMHHLLDTMADKVLAATAIAAASPAEVGIIPENSGTRLVSPRQFDTYCAPIMSEMVRRFHERGKILLLHPCGHLRDLLPAIEATGLHGIESLTPPPTGNVPLAMAREVMGPKRTLMGGLDPVWFAQATAEQVEERVSEIVGQVGDGRGFMLMPADSTPANVPMANFGAVNRVLSRHARASADQ